MVQLLAASLNRRLAGLPLDARLRTAREAIAGNLVFTTSFGIEDQVITEAIFTGNLDIDVVTLDTGRLFPETTDVWAETEARYGRRIRAFYPRAEAIEDLVAAQGINGFYDSVENRKACCHVRKVEPLNRALGGAAAWVTGLRGTQSQQRSGVTFAEFDAARGLIKINPVADYTREQVLDAIDARDIPNNVLYSRGFASIGCAPCTRAIALNESERAGRWWWEDENAKECGLHVGPDGVRRRAREVPAPDGAYFEHKRGDARPSPAEAAE
jgi:phosphoadenosine phosphosulfate reductase